MNTVPNGVMIGFLLLPCGNERKVAMHGSLEELVAVAQLLKLFPDPQQVHQMEAGEELDLLFFSDGYGSYVTLQPVSTASAFLTKATR